MASNKDRCPSKENAHLVRQREEAIAEPEVTNADNVALLPPPSAYIWVTLSHTLSTILDARVNQSAYQEKRRQISSQTQNIQVHPHRAFRFSEGWGCNCQEGGGRRRNCSNKKYGPPQQEHYPCGIGPLTVKPCPRKHINELNLRFADLGCFKSRDHLRNLMAMRVRAGASTPGFEVREHADVRQLCRARPLAAIPWRRCESFA